MAYFDAPYRPADLTLNSDAINNDLVGFWPLTDGSGTSAVDVSTGGNNGTLSGGATWSPTTLGTAASFDGVNGTEITVPGLSITQPATISLWFKTTGDGKFIDGDDSTDRIQLYFSSTYLRGYAGSTVNIGNSNEFNDDEWHHVVGVFNGSSSVFYADGVQRATGNPGSRQLSGARIGAGWNSTVVVSGNVQNVRIFNAALTAAQVEQLHTRPWTGTNFDTEALWLSPPASPVLSSASEATALMSSCVSWWPLTEGSGTTATDLVGSNDGTITNGAWAAETVGTAADLGTTSNVSGTGVNVSTAATFSLWYKDSGGTASGSMLFSLPRSAGGADGVNIQNRGSGVRFTVYSTATGALSSATATFSINDGDWHHIAGTYDGANIRLYADGAQLATNTQTGTIGHLANGEFNINALSSGTSGFSCDGFYQNVRIFSSALTADQVRLLYERPWIGAEFNETAPLYPPVPSSLTPLDSGNSILTDLEGWWPLTETDNFASGAADIGGNSNTGTKSGGVTSEFSEVGTAANFDNTGHIDVGKSFWDSGVVSANAFTVNAWFKVDNNTADHGIFGSWNSAQEALNIWVDVGGSNVSLTAICGDGTTQAITSVDAPIVTVGQWHMGTVVFDGSANTLKVYLDGVYSNKNSSATATLTSAPMGFHIGDDGSGSRTMEGLIQNCRLWSRVLTATEVADIYYSPWLGSSAYPSTSTGAPRFLINGLRPLLVNGGLVR